jgi:hypothetical protein
MIKIVLFLYAIIQISKLPILIKIRQFIVDIDLET